MEGINASESCLNVPMALVDGASEEEIGFEPKESRYRNAKNAQDAEQFILGPMPPQEFLDAFLVDNGASDRTKHRLSHKYAFSAVPPRAVQASEIYEPLIAELNKTTKHRSRCPGFTFANTSLRVEHPKRLYSMKPHVCCYASKHLETVRSADIASRIDLGYAELFIEVKPTPEQDFFTDPPPTADAEARKSHQFILNIDDVDLRPVAEQALGQHIFYATEICARQHRSFCFSISLSGSCARIIRWDRAGGIATESFDIRKQPGLLCEFLWRFAQLSDADRGFDSTVDLASETEEKMFLAAITQHVKLQLDVEGDELKKAVGEHYKPGFATVIRIPIKGADDCRIHRFIVSRPMISPLWLTGRGTRGYWAVDSANSQVVFLKDTWRSPGEQEGTILRGLNGRNIRHIPTLICHGDVPQYLTECDDEIQYTKTSDYRRAPWMSEGTVGYGLKRFKGTEELLHATYDAFQAMIDAFVIDHRIHRDISAANIILVKEPESHIRKGYLIDWEVSCKLNSQNEASKPGRKGTWPFMSCRILIKSHAPQTLQDDMESLFYVVLHTSLRWLPHDLSTQALGNTLERLFYELEDLGDELLGGNGKYVNMTTGRYTNRVTFGNELIKKWIDMMMSYRNPPDDCMHGIEFPDSWRDYKNVGDFWRSFFG
ncbi:hypothetical protein A0H81_08716 [Grifola frondosa]|uniref:Fungal-type protein kinase domain-containing protein n=1 Tax=Grifola frondosa TaxID=5627 RepID=A0A1C7M4K8_GRIFR|nr:hypothetical protein A0H81_08716 [Grifola frondosa]